MVCAARRERICSTSFNKNRTAEEKPSAALIWVSRPGPRFGLLGGVSMDRIDALWYGMVTPGEVLEKQDEKQKSLARLIERNRAELAALHPEAEAI